jgi:hypothetical protein
MWQRGEWVVRYGISVDRFVEYLPDGRVVTWNAGLGRGGFFSVSPVEALRALTEGRGPS